MKLEKLYRGVSVELDNANDGKLLPLGSDTESSVSFGQKGVRFGAGYNFGVSRGNAIRAHHVDSQMKKLGFLSTTRNYNVAVAFATKRSSVDGYVYTLDVNSFELVGVECHELNDPIYPDEQEVSISYKSGAEIPCNVILKKELIRCT